LLLLVAVVLVEIYLEAEVLVDLEHQQEHLVVEHLPKAHYL
jgi:hypothetical protein